MCAPIQMGFLIYRHNQCMNSTVDIQYSYEMWPHIASMEKKPQPSHSFHQIFTCIDPKLFPHIFAGDGNSRASCCVEFYFYCYWRCANKAIEKCNRKNEMRASKIVWDSMSACWMWFGDRTLECLPVCVSNAISHLLTFHIRLEIVKRHSCAVNNSLEIKQ